MQCPHCGAEVLAGNTFCQRCRKRVAAPGAAPASRPALRQEPVSRPAPSARPSSSTNGQGGESFQRPGWVTLLAVLFLLGAAACLVGTAAIAVPLLHSAFPRSAVLWIFPALYLGVGALYLATGIGLWRLRPWGRYLAIAFAIIGLLGIPIGTIISILLLVYLFRAGTKILFSDRSPSDLSPEEWEEVRRAGKGTGLFVIILTVMIFAVLLIVAAIVIPSLLRARVLSNESAARGALRTIIIAEVEYSQANGGLFDNIGCLTAPAKCIPGYSGRPAFLDPATFSNETRHGYSFRFVAGPRPDRGAIDPARVSSTAVKSFVIIARPAAPGSSGIRTYCGDASGLICPLGSIDERELSRGQCPTTCAIGS